MSNTELENLRYEKKFIIPEDQKDLEILIKHNPALFSEIFYQRKVNNIYLDSMNLKNYNENLAGNSQRFKVRIRWYGKTFGLIKKPALELKIKNNELGKKSHFDLKPFVLDKNFSLKSLQEVFLQSSLPNWLIEKLKLCHPTLLNSYKRKYFMSADKKYRITIDWDQIFFKIKNKSNLFLEKIPIKEFCVLEIKYLLKDFEKTADITQYFPSRVTANSKYINGINLLDF